MKFTNIRAGENGMLFDVETSPQEVDYLMTYAVENLMKEGIIAIAEFPSEQEVSLRSATH